METDIIKIINRILDERQKALVIPPCVSCYDVLGEVYKVIEANFDIRRGFNDGLIFSKDGKNS